MATLLPFASRLLPAPITPAFADPDWWTWCGSAIRGDDGRIHLFASRWPRELPFFNGYLAASRIVHAVANQPLGPFVYQRDLWPASDSGRWDARMTHNPGIIRFGGRFWLFYIGLTCSDPLPDMNAPFAQWRDIYRRIRIGVASAETLDGEFTRPDRPTIDTDVAPWEHFVTTNPSPVVTPEGRVRVYYRTPRPEGGKVRNVLAVAEADSPAGPYRPLRDEPLLPPHMHLEDPHIWWNGREYEAVAKDLEGNIAGQWGGGVHLHSSDGLAWELAPEARAYQREVRLRDGGTMQVGNMERPWLLRSDSGDPRTLYVAMSDDPRGFHHATRTWLGAIPLA